MRVASGPQQCFRPWKLCQLMLIRALKVIIIDCFLRCSSFRMIESGGFTDSISNDFHYLLKSIETRKFDFAIKFYDFLSLYLSHSLIKRKNLNYRKRLKSPSRSQLKQSAWHRPLASPMIDAYAKLLQHKTLGKWETAESRLFRARILVWVIINGLDIWDTPSSTKNNQWGSKGSKLERIAWRSVVGETRLITEGGTMTTGFLIMYIVRSHDWGRLPSAIRQRNSQIFEKRLIAFAWNSIKGFLEANIGRSVSEKSNGRSWNRFAFPSLCYLSGHKNKFRDYHSAINLLENRISAQHFLP